MCFHFSTMFKYRKSLMKILLIEAAGTRKRVSHHKSQEISKLNNWLAQYSEQIRSPRYIVKASRPRHKLECDYTTWALTACPIFQKRQ